MEFAKHIEVVADGVAVFNADEESEFSLSPQVVGLVGRTRQSCFGAVLREHFLDRVEPAAGELDRVGPSVGRPRTLGDKDHQKSAVHPALTHAREINLAPILFPGMALCDVESRPLHDGGPVEMRVQCDHGRVQFLGAFKRSV